MAVTTHSWLTIADHHWHIRYWWKHRHGINAGAIRDILRLHFKHLRPKMGKKGRA